MIGLVEVFNHLAAPLLLAILTSIATTSWQLYRMSSRHDRVLFGSEVHDGLVHETKMNREALEEEGLR